MSSIETFARELCNAISPDSTGLREYVAQLRAALDAPKGFTVCLQQVGDTGTTHVTYHAVEDRSEAVSLASAECRNDWDLDDSEELHLFAVLAGDVRVIEWDDQE